MNLTAFVRVAAACAVAIGAVAGTQTPAIAISEYSISTGDAKAFHAGSKVPVTVNYLWRASSCSVVFVGASRSAPQRLAVRGLKAHGNVRAPKTPGIYRPRVACGKDGVGTGRPFMVVPAGNPVQASCDIVDHGATIAPDGGTTFGVIVRNASPDLTAASVEIAISYLDAGGNVVVTSTDYIPGIAPGQTVFGNDHTSAPGAVSTSVRSRCTTSLETVRAPLSATGTAEPSYFSGLRFVGQVTNTTAMTLSTMSKVNVIARGADGRIVAGDFGYLDAFAPPGATVTWDAGQTNLYRVNPPVATVEAQVLPESQD